MMRFANRSISRQLAKLVASLLAVALLVTSNPVFAGPEDEPTPAEMAADVLVARPIGTAITAAGALLFVVSLPFSFLGGNVDKAAQKLVVGPAREAFVRCLGCENVGRYRKPKEE